MNSDNYKDNIDKNNIRKVNEILKDMPAFIKDYFDFKGKSVSTKTLLGYAYDTQGFIKWIFGDKDISNLTIEDISKINTENIEGYIKYLQNDSVKNNLSITINRKISALNSMFKYLVNTKQLLYNPCELIDFLNYKPKQKNLLTKDEINIFLNTIKCNNRNVSQRQNSYLDITKNRNYTIALLLITTGIRINECVGLNIESVNLTDRTIIVRRETNIKLILCDKTAKTLDEYIKMRKKIKTESDALFLSLQNKRICTQAIEDMLKKYSVICNMNNLITPKIFRNTFLDIIIKNSKDFDFANSYLGIGKISDIKIMMNKLNKEEKTYIKNTLNASFSFIA